MKRTSSRSGVSRRTFYVSDTDSADDRNDGRTPKTAWRSIRRVQQAALRAGDTVLLRGGATFKGNLVIDRASAATTRRPLTIGAFGRGPATILAGAGTALIVRDAGGVRVRDLVLIGNGPRNNRGNGVSFENRLTGDVRLAHVRIHNVEARGFGRFGVRIGGHRGKSGYADVRIVGVVARDNREGGIEVHGCFSQASTAYANADVTIARCDAFDNPGYARSRRHVGDGIVISDVDEAVIEHCRAWGNGGACTYRDGPVGIWAWDANRVIIRDCLSYANRAAGPADGGGFDLDGGVTNSVIQRCISHDNDGAGFGVYQFRYARPMHANVIRDNLSVNDGRRNGYGGITFMNLGSGVNDIEVTGNTVYVAPPPDADPRQFPPAVRLKSRTVGVRIHGNLLVAAGGARFLRTPGKQKEFRFDGNVCRTVE